MQSATVEHPTYIEHIRFLFTADDQACMGRKGIDLRTYEGVKANALRIYSTTREGRMPPPDEGRRWSETDVETFYRWIRDGFPRGSAKPTALIAASLVTESRVRSNIADLDPNGPEIVLLKKAFEGMMARDAEDPQSYFHIAGLHWLPGPGLYCRHHENAYNPWHRAYQMKFEDALRSVPDCENVTLPYWDIASGVLPRVLTEPPFDTYQLPRDLHSLGGQVFMAGSKMERYPVTKIEQNILNYGIASTIEAALGSSRWEDFNGWHADDGPGSNNPVHGGIIRAHDAGHLSVGDRDALTMANQDVAAFDPLFWFFHGNWDRIWWRWQQAYQAANLADFKTLLRESAEWLTDPVINGLPPFDTTSDKTIDLSSLGVDYVHPPSEIVPENQQPIVAAVSAMSGMELVQADRLVVRLSGINRLNIPGSFVVSLLADGDPVQQVPLFQPTAPKMCETCRKTGIMDIKFLVDRTSVEGKRLTAEISVGSGKDGTFPLSEAGDPKLDVHLLLAE